MTRAMHWFIDHGVGVFPLKDRSKEPACPSWDDYAGPVRSLNYGVRLGPCRSNVLVVVDTDNPETETWASAHLHTPFVVSTGRGRHRYFRMLALPPTRFLHRDGLVIELKGHGQYVVGPDSVHPSGAVYTASDWSWAWNDIPLFPEAWLVDDGSCGSRSTAGEPFMFPERVVAGERHDMLFRLIRSFKGLGADRDEARGVVSLANAERCTPPVREDRAFEQWFNRAWCLPDRPLTRTIDDPVEDDL